jgi:phage FluMu gp28-like protein
MVTDGSRRFNVVACGRRFGKTLLGLDRLVEAALAGRPVAWFSPTYRMMAEVWRDLRQTLAPVAERVNVQEHRLELLTGGVIDLWSLDTPDVARGRKYARVVVDEAAMVRDLAEAWEAVIRPTLADYRGDAWFLSTPRGLGYFWQMFARGEDPAQPDWVAWRMPTVANPFIPPDEVEAARDMLPERVFAQEFLAEFLEDQGSVFRNVAACVDPGRSAADPPIGHRRYVMGVDLARVSDFTVLAVLDESGRQVYFERFNQISWERQVGAIERAAREYRARVYLDSTGVGDPIFEALRKRGLDVAGYQLTNASKEALIDALAMRLESGSLRLMDVPAQANELLAYQYELTPSRNVRMNAPPGMHDDCVIALALAAHGLSARGRGAVAVPNPLAGWRG